MDSQKKIEVLDSIDVSLERISELATDLIHLQRDQEDIKHYLERIADAIETIADNTKKR
jgi:hypothetical protein